MLKYVLVKRIPQIILVMFLALTLSFYLVRAIPGDPIEVMLGESPATPEMREHLRKVLGLDRPIHEQYLIYIQRLLSGDWGKSIFMGIPVRELIFSRFINTLLLATCSMILSIMIGIPLGVIAALKRESIIDHIIRGVTLFGYSIPVFWWGLILIYVFSVNLKLLPSIGFGTPQHLILPSITVATLVSASIARITRISMLEVLNQDYVIAGKAKGLSQYILLRDYILRNAIIPVVTIVGLNFGTLLTGSVVTETIFAYPGIGKLMVDAMYMRDYPIVTSGIFFLALMFSLVNLLVDILYTYLDPRVKLERSISV
jgi:ABC-type dipeptide/oligopeptide/nickel transport system permease component